MNSKQILIISDKETFSVHGLKMKLSEIGIESTYAHAGIKALSALDFKGKLIIYYMDESVYENASFMVYLKDLCQEKENSLILIGKKAEYEEVAGTVPKNCIDDWFERPLDMKKLLDKIIWYMDRIEQEQMRKTILIIDDDVSYMQMVREGLKDKYHVVMVNSGIKAIKWLAVNEADLVLLDYEMPVTTGPQILEMLKSDTESDVVPVMFLTGQRNKESVLRAVQLNPIDYLLKGMGQRSLRKKIDEYFNRWNL